MGRRVWVRDKPKNSVSEGKGRWSEKKQIEAITVYLATGKISLTAASLGIPLETLRYWMRQPWWKQRVEELQREETLELDQKLRKIVDKSLDSVMDMLENGDHYYDPRTGKVRRVPAKLRDVQKVATDVIDKRALLRKADPAQKEEKQQITADHLVQLANAFAQMAKGKHNTEMQTPIYDVDIIPNEEPLLPMNED